MSKFPLEDQSSWLRDFLKFQPQLRSLVLGTSAPKDEASTTSGMHCIVLSPRGQEARFDSSSRHLSPLLCVVSGLFLGQMISLGSVLPDFFELSLLQVRNTHDSSGLNALSPHKFKITDPEFPAHASYAALGLHTHTH